MSRRTLRSTLNCVAMPRAWHVQDVRNRPTLYEVPDGIPGCMRLEVVHITPVGVFHRHRNSHRPYRPVTAAGGSL